VSGGAATLSAMNHILLTTTPSVEGRPIREYRGIVTGEAILGQNVVYPLASLRDLVGLRSGTGPNELGQARELALDELRARALELGANAVVSVDLRFEAIGPNSCMLLVSASGTAVVL